jgi:hypothetical protein
VVLQAHVHAHLQNHGLHHDRLHHVHLQILFHLLYLHVQVLAYCMNFLSFLFLLRISSTNEMYFEVHDVANQ